jgi:hypothetical protein
VVRVHPAVPSKPPKNKNNICGRAKAGFPSEPPRDHADIFSQLARVPTPVGLLLPMTTRMFVVDGTLSRLKHGFESRRERHENQTLSRY